MTDKPFAIDRRTLIGALGVTLLGPSSRCRADAQTPSRLALEAVAVSDGGKPEQPAGTTWQFKGGADPGPLRFRQGETVDVTLTNRLPRPVVLDWIGLDGSPATEPMTGQTAVAPGASASYPVTFRHPGTMLLDLLPIGGDGAERPSVARPIVVTETEPIAVDKDDVLLIAASSDNPQTFTINGRPTVDLTVRQNQRLRLRLINSQQNSVIALQFIDQAVRIMAIDGQPSEPFLARDGRLVMGPGARIDVFVDVIAMPGAKTAINIPDGRETKQIGQLIVSDDKPARDAPMPPAASLPATGLPAQIDLKSALRIELPLGSPDWTVASALTPTTPPAFKVKRGRTVVIALVNRGTTPATFHLHGHHVRLLDRLDDGWKPFWLDTLTIGAGQTQRVAFVAEYAGFYPMQAVVNAPNAPRLFRSYLVE